MSARTAIAALMIVAVVVGAGALAYVALSPPDASQDDSSSRRGGAEAAPDDDDGGATVAPLGTRSSEAAPAPEDGAPWLEFVGYEDALQAIHWDEVGATYVELLPLLEARFKAVTREKALPEADRRRIEELWGTLDVLAAPMRERVPYVWGNGVFAHPAYVANSVAATLHATGRGLTPEQLERLRAAMEEALATEEHIENLQHDPMLPGTVRAMAEVEARRGVSDAIESVLTERQSGTLHPKELATRVGLDPFHAVELFRGKLIVVNCDDLEAGARELAELVVAEVGGDEVRIAEGVLFAQGPIDLASREAFPEGARLIDVAGHIDIECTFFVARHSGEFMTNFVLLLAGGEMPLIPPEVLDRPIILVRTTND